MKIALITNQNTYSGREFLGALHTAGVIVDVISIGRYPSFSEHEEKRCNGTWNPPPEEELRSIFKYYDFDSLKSDELVALLQENKYDLGIQGGTDKIRQNVLQYFKQGMLNFHPGKLPEYRGCSSPEWQLYENKPITCTCHFVDEGIDTGDIYDSRVLDKCTKKSDYFSFRGSLYPEVATYVVDIVTEILSSGVVRKGIVQPEEGAIYRPYISDEQLIQVKQQFSQ